MKIPVGCNFGNDLAKAPAGVFTKLYGMEYSP